MDLGTIFNQKKETLETVRDLQGPPITINFRDLLKASKYLIPKATDLIDGVVMRVSEQAHAVDLRREVRGGGEVEGGAVALHSHELQCHVPHDEQHGVAEPRLTKFGNSLTHSCPPFKHLLSEKLTSLGQQMFERWE